MRILEPMVYALQHYTRWTCCLPSPSAAITKEKTLFFFSQSPQLHPEQGGQLGKRLGHYSAGIWLLSPRMGCYQSVCLEWWRNVGVGAALICNMMHKKPRSNWSVSCLQVQKPQTKQFRGGTNHWSHCCFYMHNAVGCRPPRRHPRAEPTQWLHCLQKTHIPHMRHSLHTDKSPAHPTLLNWTHFRKHKQNPLGRLEERQRSFSSKPKGPKRVNFSRPEVSHSRSLRNHIRSCLKGGGGRLGWKFFLPSPTRPSATARAAFWTETLMFWG